MSFKQLMNVAFFRFCCSGACVNNNNNLTSFTKQYKDNNNKNIFAECFFKFQFKLLCKTTNWWKWLKMTVKWIIYIN